MSPIKPLNTLLLIAAVTGGVLTYLASRTYQQLAAEKTRLEQKVGSLRIGDPSKMHVRALDTGEPLHFAWRVYLPPNFKPQWRSDSSSGSRSSISQSCEYVARVRFRESDKDGIEVFIKEESGSGRSSLGNRQLADLLHGRWDEIQVEQLGREGLAVVEPDEIATLLRLTLSESLKQEVEQKLQWNGYRTKLFDYQVGSQKAFQKAEAEQSLANP